MQDTLGEGVAPAIGDISDSIGDDGYFTGGTSVASDVAEMFLMQLGGDLTVAWDSLNSTEVYRYLAAHIYYRGVQDRAQEVVAYDHSYMAAEIVNTLKGGFEEGTRVMVGHDGDLDALAVLFGLEWVTPPFPTNATTPGSALRFDVDENDDVKLTVYYQVFDGSDTLLESDVDFTWTTEKSVSIGALEEFISLTDDCNPT